MLSTKNGHLVTEHEDLDVLGCAGASEQRQPAQRAGKHPVREADGHMCDLARPALVVTARSAGRELADQR